MLNKVTQKITKMHARRNPGLSLQPTAQYSQLEAPPHSATSSAFLSPTLPSRRGLLARSPPASPSLPSLVPKHGKIPHPNHGKFVKRVLLGCCGVAFLLWIVLRHMYTNASYATPYDDEVEDEWEMVGGSRLPHEPSAVALIDAKGKMRWTVSIPSTYDFPLQPAQYREICHQAMEVSKEVSQGPEKATSHARRMVPYNQKDQYYIDIKEAEEQALLPPAKSKGRPKNFVEDQAMKDGASSEGLKVCERSLTYVMETGDAGFGNTLMRLWMSYGLAKTENRAFFIDDSRWPYGKYSTYFQPPPSAGCLPPPPSHIVPCPHSANHLVVSEATVKSTFGHAFTEQYEDARKVGVYRQSNIFALARTGYEALFKLRPDDEAYVLEKSHDMYGAVKLEGGLSIGMHVRHGDKHPMEYQYAKDYIPLARYIETARELYIEIVEGESRQSRKRSSSSRLSSPLTARHTSSKMILASDDPLVYDSPELGPNSMRAQDRIVLATKQQLEAAQKEAKKNAWIDEITGWEGGFYRDVFFSLGQPVGNAKDMKEVSKNPAADVPESAMKLRELIGRAYLLDLAVLAKADTLICTVSSVTCRLLAITMGWNDAIGATKWRNIDGSFEWRGIIW